MRPVDLARRHQLSTQAVRNYEDAGILPAARRTRTGHRQYGEVHLTGLAAYLALVSAYGPARSRQIMQAITAGRRDAALALLEAGQQLLSRDRHTLRSADAALAGLDGLDEDVAIPVVGAVFSIGELARRLGLNPATMRAWERAGVLTPGRDPRSGHRRYGASDVRDAELAHLLRRGGQPLDGVAVVLAELRGAGSRGALAATVEEWRRDLRLRGIAQLRAAGKLADYIDALDQSG